MFHGVVRQVISTHPLPRSSVTLRRIALCGIKLHLGGTAALHDKSLVCHSCLYVVAICCYCLFVVMYFSLVWHALSEITSRQAMPDPDQLRSGRTASRRLGQIFRNMSMSLLSQQIKRNYTFICIYYKFTVINRFIHYLICCD